MVSSLEDAWHEQRVWSQIANRLKADLQRRRNAALALAIVGAVLSTAAATIGLSTTLGKTMAFLSAACIGVAGLIQARISSKGVQDWTRARSVSEAIKSEVYLALAGFGAADVEAEVRKVAEDAADLLEHRVGVTPEKRALPNVHDVESYLTERVDDQIKRFYEKRAVQLKARLKLFRGIEVGLATVGVLLGAAAGTWELDSIAVWVPVTTTIGAAVAAHAAAERYAYLLVEYMRTADELHRIRERRGSAATLTDEQLVQRAEETISIQNQAWMAKMTAAS
jgi:SMODS and SLOG-associating 2TM effector domain 1/Protein of unknown function (DUF4231)